MGVRPSRTWALITGLKGGSRKVPEVSVLMPAFNAAEFLSEAVESVLAQTFKDFEFIIVDDGSIDGSREIMTHYAKRDRRIRIMENAANRGIVFSLNRGLCECRGRYVARMDADDIALEDRIEKQVSTMELCPETVALGGAVTYIDRKGRELGCVRLCETGGSLLARNPLLHPTVVFRQDNRGRARGLYQERFRYAEDYFCWLEMSKRGRIDAINDVVLKYRISPNAVRMSHLKRVLLATFKVKIAGVFELGIRPQLWDVARLMAELSLFLLPSWFLRLLYVRFMFGKEAKGVL